MHPIKLRVVSQGQCAATTRTAASVTMWHPTRCSVRSDGQYAATEATTRFVVCTHPQRLSDSSDGQRASCVMSWPGVVRPQPNSPSARGKSSSRARAHALEEISRSATHMRETRHRKRVSPTYDAANQRGRPCTSETTRDFPPHLPNHPMYSNSRARAVARASEAPRRDVRTQHSTMTLHTQVRCRPEAAPDSPTSIPALSPALPRAIVLIQGPSHRSA